MKKSFFILPLLILILSGCGKSEADLVSLAADMVCLADETMREVTMIAADEAAMQQKGKEFEQEMKALVTSYGFETEADAEEAFEDISDKQAFGEKVEMKVETQCNGGGTMMNEFLQSLSAD